MSTSSKKIILGTFIVGLSILIIHHPIKCTFLEKVGKGIVRIAKRAVLGENFYTVEQGTLYRSRQLKPQELDHRMKQFGIKAVINLRGKQKNKKWWQEEQRVVQQNNGILFNIPMRAATLTPLTKLMQLGAILIAAPRPMLVHCYAGSDRTGEAAATHKLIQGKPVSEALGQLSIRYGHSALKFPNKCHLIGHLGTIYPDFLHRMASLRPSHRYTVDELKGCDAQGLLQKLKNIKL